MSELDQMKDYCEIHREHIIMEVKQLIDAGDKSIKSDLESSLSKAMAEIENRLLARMDDRFQRFDSKQDGFNLTLNRILWVLIGACGIAIISLVGVVMGRAIDIGVWF